MRSTRWILVVLCIAWTMFLGVPGVALGDGSMLFAAAAALMIAAGVAPWSASNTEREPE